MQIQLLYIIHPSKVNSITTSYHRQKFLRHRKNEHPHLADCYSLYLLNGVLSSEGYRNLTHMSHNPTIIIISLYINIPLSYKTAFMGCSSSHNRWRSLIVMNISHCQCSIKFPLHSTSFICKHLQALLPPRRASSKKHKLSLTYVFVIPHEAMWIP
jgi:hypothetical protein